MKYDRIRTLQSINALKGRSAWRRAVNEYAYELAESIEDGKEFKDINSFAIELLNGACDWCEYSEGGCSLISDYEIAERLCTPSKFKKKKYGELPPYRGMSWIALQGRALCAASYVVKSHLKIKNMEAKYRVVVLGCLKKLNTEEEVVEEYVNYLSTIVSKRQVMSFSVLYEDGGNRGAIVATGRQISVIAGREKMTSLVNKMRTPGVKNEN